MVIVPYRLPFPREVTLLRKISRIEFFGDVPSGFPSLFGVTEPFHAELECALRLHAMFE